MTDLLTTFEIKASVRVSPVLSDSDLATIANRIEAMLESRLGPLSGPVQETFLRGDQQVQLSRYTNDVVYVRPVGSDGSASTDSADDLQYLIKDRFVLHAWYQLWPSVIEVSYNPIDTTDVRKQALVQLINVELNQGFAQSPDGDRSPMSRAALSEAAIAQAKRAEQPGVYA